MAVWSKELVSNKEAHTQNQKDDDALIVELIEVLEGIDTTKPSAKLNETSIIDSTGGRIYF